MNIELFLLVQLKYEVIWTRIGQIIWLIFWNTIYIKVVQKLSASPVRSRGNNEVFFLL